MLQKPVGINCALAQSIQDTVQLLSQDDDRGVREVAIHSLQLPNWVSDVINSVENENPDEPLMEPASPTSALALSRIYSTSSLFEDEFDFSNQSISPVAALIGQGASGSAAIESPPLSPSLPSQILEHTDVNSVRLPTGIFRRSKSMSSSGRKRTRPKADGLKTGRTHQTELNPLQNERKSAEFISASSTSPKTRRKSMGSVVNGKLKLELDDQPSLENFTPLIATAHPCQ